MKRYLWESSLSITSCPAWPCAVCRNGVLRLRPKSLTYEETVASKRWHGTDDWGPEHIQFVFNTWVECTYESCKQAFAVIGTGGVEQQYDGGEDGSTEWVERFYPESIVPTLEMLDLPARSPRPVMMPLREAFALFWSQPEACAGRIRVALEALLTYVGVPSEETVSSGKQAEIPLHRRIELYAKESPDIGKQLMALKWIGNAGSHGGKVTKSDILDALELLEHSLIEVLDRRSEKMANLAEKLTKKHGP